jgi:hypothetical protein
MGVGDDERHLRVVGAGDAEVARHSDELVAEDGDEGIRSR